MCRHVSTEVEVARQRQILGEALLGYLDGLPADLREDVKETLEEEGKLLHQPASIFDGRWALVPLYLAYELGECGEQPAACHAALAVECIVCATDLFDDVMDGDMTPLIRRLGMARVLNVALALISLAQRILLTLVDRNFSAVLPFRLLNACQQALLQASSGQRQDLLVEQRSVYAMSQEDCIEIAAAKAGSLLELACRLGAVCAGIEEERVERCAEMGRLLGIAAQFDNDAHDLLRLLQPQAVAGSKTDLQRGKKTLPVVLAAHSLCETQALDPEEFARTLQGFSSLAPKEQVVYRAALREGILTTWGFALLYRERAGDCLREAMDGRPIAEHLCRILGLTSLIESKNE